MQTKHFSNGLNYGESAAKLCIGRGFIDIKFLQLNETPVFGPFNIFRSSINSSPKNVGPTGVKKRFLKGSFRRFKKNLCAMWIFMFRDDINMALSGYQVQNFQLSW
jgi:hypothetical protein